ncbi:Hypothetical predicted protein [Mytilus galloprovincialis]|uniref:Kazal-like domain-containing protein n=1 Tax=Mytilus galloprovincialis TaxID=29158 RepID=A0A8B6GY79_MYTGA|nr:Hypothetical predicted protein [Mytilus galloprovincialis]
MENDIKKSMTLSYWLVLVVLLLFEHPAAVALTVGGVSYKNHVDTDQTDAPENCSDWEEFDGIECVCASTSEGCSDDMGMVCDEQGVQYRSSCLFSLQMCQQNISIDDSIVSCGACDTLRLTGGKNYPKGITLAKFLRQGPEAGLSTRYKSINDNETEIFFVSELNAWAIGKSGTNGSFVSMVQPANASFPGDGIPGMLIPNQNGTDITWEFDKSFRLECVEDHMEGVREKRFIFMAIFAAISVATAVTTTTLHIVQATKGCLYYPSVCTMRDEIKSLLPSLRRDKDRFLSVYGEPKEFEYVVDKIHDQIQIIQEKIIKIPELHTTLNISLSSLVHTYSSMRHDFPQLENLLSNYDDWLSSALKAARNDVAMLPLDVLMAIPALVAESATSMALAMSGIGAVLSFAFGIVDVVSSVLEEKNVRDQLQRNKNVLVGAREKLNRAFNDMKTFQNKFCRFVIKYFEEISKKGRQYEPTFDSLYRYVSQIYGLASNRCNNPAIVAHSNLRNLKQIQQNYLQPIVQKLSGNVESFKVKILEVKETKAFLDEINRQVKQQHKNPAEIFRFIKTNKPMRTNKMFGNLFKLLTFISKSVLRTNNCYWGQNLEQIRRGLTTDHTYTRVPVCSSNEISVINNVIKAAVHNQEAICKIHRQVQGSVFRDKFQTVRFIADNILPTQQCYWGYDLDDIRGTPNTTEIRNAKVDSSLLSTLYNLESVGQIALARNMMEGMYSIHSTKWQNFLLCHVWKNQAALSNLHCNHSTASSACIPSVSSFQSC